MLCHRNSREGLATGGALAVCAIQPFDHATLLATDTAQTSAAVSTTRCGDTCPIFPGKRYEDWQLDDPAGLGLEAVRTIRNEIETRVRVLIAELLGPQETDE
jgi:protein-tyrosine-phosphatase